MVGGYSTTAAVLLLDSGRPRPAAIHDATHGEVADGGELPGPVARVQPASRALTVLVGSDDPFTRYAFRTGASSPGISVVAAGTVAEVANQLAVELGPDIVLLDVQTNAASALRAIQRLRTRTSGARILACAAPAGTEFGLLCLSAGAWGYVSKEVDLAVLPRILRALAEGEAVIPRALGTELVRRFTRGMSAESSRSSGELSAPECRLLELLRTGQTLPEAAAELGITQATARRHFGSARRKLSISLPQSKDANGDSHEKHHWEV